MIQMTAIGKTTTMKVTLKTTPVGQGIDRMVLQLKAMLVREKHKTLITVKEINGVPLFVVGHGNTDAGYGT